MEGLGSTADETAGPGTTAHNEDTHLLNTLVDEDDGGFRADQSFLEEIARKQAEIIHGFPLASLTGVSGVANHLPPLDYAPVTAFPYPPPKASGSLRSSDYSRKHSDDTRTHFHDDPVFKGYDREIRLLMGTTKLKDDTVDPVEWTQFKAHARGALHQAMQMQAKESSKIIWKDPPFGNPAGVKLETKYEPSISSFPTLRDADPSGYKSLAAKLLDDLHFPYPSPASRSRPSLCNPPATIYNPSKEVAFDHLTTAQRTSLEESKTFLRDLIKPQSGSSRNGEGVIGKFKSPIPLIPAPSVSSAAVTPLKFDGMYLHPKSEASLRPVASSSSAKTPIQSRPYSNAHPHPSSHDSSSPDPLAGPQAKSTKSTIKGEGSSPRWVVGPPSYPRKRPSTLDLQEEETLKRHAPHFSSDALNTHIPPNMDVDAVEAAKPYTAKLDSPPNQMTLPSRKQSLHQGVQSSRKPSALKSTSQMDEQQVRGFSDLVDEILDAQESGSSGFFIEPSQNSRIDCTRGLLLTPSCMRRIGKAVRVLAKSNSGRRTFEQAVDIDQMIRLLAVLQRSIDAAHTLVIVPKAVKKGKAREGKSPKKTPRKGKRGRQGESISPRPSSSRRRSSRSATPASYCEDADERSEHENGSGDEEEEEDFRGPETPSSQSRQKLNKRPSASSASKGRKGNASKAWNEAHDEYVWDKDTLAELESDLVVLKNAIIAIDTVMVILESGSLPKQLYSEDLINLGLNVLKTHLPSVIYPSLDPERSPLGYGVHDERIATLIRKILTSASSTIASMGDLLKLENATDATLISAVYIAIAPFFSEPTTAGKTKDLSASLEMKVIRSQSLAAIRTIFAKYPEQRQWIVEEVLSSITKLPDLAKRKPQYMLHSGQAIQAISALLLHIVQSCTSGLRGRMLQAIKQQTFEVPNDDIQAMDDESPTGLTVPIAQEHAERLLEAAVQCARVIVGYLVKRSGKAPKNSTAGEAEYKALLEHFVRDLLVVADLPGWPAAALMLELMIRSMTTVLDDPKVTADVNTAKGISLEHLGTIASWVFKMAQASKASSVQQHAGGILPLTHILRQQDRRALRRLVDAEHAHIQLLLDDPDEMEGVQSAVDFVSARWSAEMLQALRILRNQEDGHKDKFEKQLCLSQDTLWQMLPSGSSFKSSHDEHRITLQQSLRTLFPVHGLGQSMDTLLAHILGACEGAVIAFRQKALKALASIVEQDPSIFLHENVQEAVEKRLMDSSAAVRDAALEMLGRYVVYRPELAQEYLAKIEERINDSGLSVRKRVIRLLRSLYPVVDGLPERASICRRLVGRVYDEDDNVKELACATFEEIFLTVAQSSQQIHRNPEGAHSGLTRKREILSRSRVLLSVAADFRDRPSPLEDVLRMIFEKHNSKKTGKGTDHLLGLSAQLKDIIEVLIDSLVDPEQSSNVKLVDCVKTVYILLAPEPSMLGTGRATLLLPYLKSATNVEEQNVVEYLAKIFTLILPTLPRSASTFAERLQDSLRGLLNKPAAIGVSALPDVVSCLCSVVVHQTGDYGKLCNIFQTCYVKLQEGVQCLTDQAKPVTPEQRAQLLRTMPILARLVSLFCQYGDFDRLREESPDAAVFINAISQSSIQQQVYNQMIQLYRLSAGTPLHGTALQCLGFLYRAHPMFMLEENSTAIMDRIFLSASNEGKALLLRNICDFLVSQTQSGHTEGKDVSRKDIDMSLLIGNADNFADSGVSSAIVQRYLHHIIEAALTPAGSQSLLRPALEAIGFTVRQGLAHPMQCLPALVALETCTDGFVASKAFALHSLLHEKHSGLINTRLAESIDTVIRYQRRVLGDSPFMGHTEDPPSALLCRWYSLMREKRQWRNDFLKAFLRGLHVEPTASKYTQDNVNVARFTAENLATLDYKTVEEVFFVVRTLTVLLSVAGMQIYHQMQKAERLDMDVDNETSSVDDSLVRKSVALGFAFCLRHQLKTVYGITEQKLAKYASGKKSSAGDKPAIPRSGEKTILCYRSLPFTTIAIQTEEDRIKQCQAYLALIDSDDSIKEADGEQDSEDEGGN